jgi:glycosyltransferase involved in cell wall biosynthesis
MFIGFIPMPVQPKRRKHIFYTMMETQGLHKLFVDRCNEGAYEVWVPCKFYKRVFEEAGVVKPIKVYPLGVDQSIYTPDARPATIYCENILTGDKTSLLPDNCTKFMSLFGWSYRKGPDVLCKSFIREFSSKDNVVLVIFARYLGSSHEQHKQVIRNEILDHYKTEGKTNPPPIYYCGDDIPISDMPGCYSQMDAFVFCSRGEGFGLPLIEAGACGLPVISTFDTAMTEYLDDDVAYIVHPAGHAPANDKLTFISEFYRDQLFSDFDESNIIQFGTFMRHVHENKEFAKAKAEKFRKRILEQYTWDVCVKRIAERLLELL